MQAATLIFIPEPIDWIKAFPFAPSTPFHFEIESKKALCCSVCKKLLESGHFASLCDNMEFKDKKRSRVWLFKQDAIKHQEGTFKLKSPILRCPRCWREGKGINPNFIHHRVVIS